MLVMLANNSGRAVRELAAEFPGQIGHLYGPGSQRGPWPEFPYALDNNAFGAWKNGTAWDETAWIELLKWASSAAIKPLWCLVPDVVADRKATLESWNRYIGTVLDHGFRPAFAVQDGMTPDDVPYLAQVVFVGGTTRWKWRSLLTWTQNFPDVHVGRVNTYDRLVEAQRAGAKGTDGTGFTRGDQRQWRGLRAFLERRHWLQMPLTGLVPTEEKGEGR